ncbi:MAG: hypothetical protein GY950_20780, partial [bacterium]|nr:hypothetical protein [bacterium]
MATLAGGLVIMDSNGRFVEVISKTSGLPDENVKYVFEDIQNNLWLGLNNGISKIEHSSPFSISNGQNGLPGLVLSVTRHQDNVYAGTSGGLYTRAPSEKFHPVPGISSNCWYLLSTDEQLLAATSRGVFQLTEKFTPQKVIENRTYILKRSEKDPNRIWAGTINGLISLYLNPKNKEKNEWLWAKEHTFEEIGYEIRTIVEDRKGNLWLGTREKGAFRVEFNDRGGIAKPFVTPYNTTHGLPPGEINVFMPAEHEMFATIKGIYRFDTQGTTFVPDPTLGEEFSNGSRSVFRIAQDKLSNIWFHSRFRNFQSIPQPDGTFTLYKKTFLRLPSDQVNTIFPDPKRDAVWFACNNGLIHYDKTSEKNYDSDFKIIVRKVLVNGKLIFDGLKNKTTGNPANQDTYPILEYKDRNLRFQFAAPFFEAEDRTLYRCRLDGYDDDWSDWTAETQKDYTNIDNGIKKFRVQAKNVYENLSNEDVFQFKIMLPWYRTWWAIISYLLVLSVLTYLVGKWRHSIRLEREKKRLEKIVNERTKEITQKNQQLETQTLQLKDQSVKLQEMDKVKSRFFANISHEFRTPLTLIMGPLEQMLSHDRDEEEEKQMNGMLRSSQRLLTLINRLLDLSRFDSGKMKL